MKIKLSSMFALAGLALASTQIQAESLVDGSAEAVMLSLLDANELDDGALDRLRNIINDKVREKKS